MAWIFIPTRLETQERREDGPRIHAAPEMNNTTAPVLRLRDPAVYDAGDPSSRRNLFAFAEVQAPPRARVVPVAVHRSPEVVAVAVAVPETPAVAAPPPLVFGYRFLGTFGPASSPIAAFASNGEVLTVREGDQIGQSFVLRRIGTQEVDVAAPDGQATQRVKIAP
ncbi:MAG TPA: hypothetical protein VF713_12240 [Thermoanaerobaculia bacterium]